MYFVMHASNEAQQINNMNELGYSQNAFFSEHLKITYITFPYYQRQVGPQLASNQMEN